MKPREHGSGRETDIPAHLRPLSPSAADVADQRELKRLDLAKRRADVRLVQAKTLATLVGAIAVLLAVVQPVAEAVAAACMNATLTLGPLVYVWGLTAAQWVMQLV